MTNSQKLSAWKIRINLLHGLGRFGSEPSILGVRGSRSSAFNVFGNVRFNFFCSRKIDVTCFCITAVQISDAASVKNGRVLWIKLQYSGKIRDRFYVFSFVSTSESAIIEGRDVVWLDADSFIIISHCAI